MALMGLIGLMVNGVQAQTAVGKWRSCLDYSQANHVVDAGDRIYAGGIGGVFCYDLDDNTLTPMSKGDGLSDVGIAAMAYDATSRCLTVAYTNANVDIVSNGHTYNLSDIKRSEIPGDKSINRVRYARGNAYLCTGFGVVVVDLKRMEIKETWYLGAGGVYTPVYDMAFTSDSLYAATGEGLKRLSASEKYPSISDRWTLDHRLDGLTVGQFCQVGSHLLASTYTLDPVLSTLYRLTSTGLDSLCSGDIRSLQAGGNRLAVCLDGDVVTYDTSLTYLGTRSSYAWGALSAYDAVYAKDGTLWVGHGWEGLMGLHADGKEEYHKPDGPFSSDRCYRLVPFNHRMMLCPGGHTSTYSNTYFSPDLLTAMGRRWTVLDKSNGLLDGKHDLLDVAVNPRDTTEMVAALWGAGVASIRDNKVESFYDASNTNGALVPFTSGSYSTLNTGAVAFDNRGNLWVLNSHSTHALAMRSRDGEWKSFSTMEMLTNPALDKLVWDSINGYLWFMGRENEIYVHDGKSKMVKVNPNNGSKLETQSVTALVQDHNGSLWLGTNKGIKVIYDGYRAFRGGSDKVAPVTCSNITITNGEFSEYLMAYESITAIAVDGANRKWVGTANGGLYLISANGLEQLAHFTFANSPLFSDKIIALGINERSGEVYIGTDKGVQVYRGTATYATSTPLEEVYAFPNPVKPGYDGPIAIKGFTRNGRVHITDAAGHTVFTTTANGGQAIWYGRNLKGEKVASGVYYVFASDDLGDNRSVAKILVIR